MKSPIFSILLPTKNRSHLVVYAVKSVLNQTFDDFELVIADNDDTEDTFNALKQYLSDKRIKYIRTGNLDMVENWNKALENSSGNFVILLEDKMIFYKNSLSRIIEEILKTDENEVLVWNCDSIQNTSDSSDSNYILKLKTERPSSSRTSDSVLTQFYKYRQASWHLLPRGLCCAIKRTVIECCMKRYDIDFYNYCSPDLTSALKVLSVADKIFYFNEPLNVVISANASNGYNLRKKKSYAYFGNEMEIKNLPFKNPYFISNLISEDIERNLILCNKLEYSPHWKSNIIVYKHELFKELAKGYSTFGFKAYSANEIKTLFLFNKFTFSSFLEFTKVYLKRKITSIDTIRSILKSIFRHNTFSYEFKKNTWDKVVGSLIESNTFERKDLIQSKE